MNGALSLIPGAMEDLDSGQEKRWKSMHLRLRTALLKVSSLVIRIRIATLQTDFELLLDRL